MGNVVTGCPAAQYLRKSTVDHQQYSIDNQVAAIEKYATERQFRIVQTYVDAGRSGLTFESRHALRQLIEDVQRGSVPFSAILVYDVSRWGRFQDADESAYYEHICKRAGVQVLYCAEPFGNDGTPLDAVMKSMKRAMAAEYSRELGAKVYAGQKRIVEMGFRLGSNPGYAFRRLLVDTNGTPKHLLKPGERKSISSDRIVLVPGPAEEIAVVRYIFRAFNAGKYETAIARSLNERGLRYSTGKPWCFSTVHYLLIAPKCAGHNVWGRTNQRLGKPPRENPSSAWVYSPQKFEAIVSQRTFDKAQETMAKRRMLHFSSAEILAGLQRLLKKHGKLSGRLIDADKSMPSDGAITWRFGSLANAYRQIGYTAPIDMSFVEINRSVRKFRDETIEQVRTMLTNCGKPAVFERIGIHPALRIGGSTVLQFWMMRCRMTDCGYPRWRIRFNDKVAGPALAICMSHQNNEAIAYYFFPHDKRPRNRSRMHFNDVMSFEPFRLDTLSDVSMLT